MRPVRRRLPFVVVVSVIFCWSWQRPGCAAEGGKESPRQAVYDGDTLIFRALELRRRGNDQAALPLLQEAFRKERTPRAAGQLGFCHQSLGQWAEAETYLGQVLDSPTDPWVVKNHAVIETALGTVRSHVGRVEVIGEPAGAEVAVNAIVVGTLPLGAPVHVSNGEVEVEVRSPGFSPKTKSFHIVGGQYQRVVLRLERDAAPAAGIATPAAAAVGAVDSGAVNSSATRAGEVRANRGDDAPAAQASDATRRSLKWIAWGAGAVGAGVGGYGFIKNQQGVEFFGRGCGLDASGVPRADTPGTTDAQCGSRKSAYEAGTVIAVVGFAGAATLAAAGFVLWATEPEAARAAR
jgi:hypothetical protein